MKSTNLVFSCCNIFPPALPISLLSLSLRLPVRVSTASQSPIHTGQGVSMLPSRQWIEQKIRSELHFDLQNIHSWPGRWWGRAARACRHSAGSSGSPPGESTLVISRDQVTQEVLEAFVLSLPEGLTFPPLLHWPKEYLIMVPLYPHGPSCFNLISANHSEKSALVTVILWW